MYSALPFSYGTLGFLTAVEIDIIPYKPYIKLRYFPVHSLQEAVNIFKRETFSKVWKETSGNRVAKSKFVTIATLQADSVEGIMYSLNEGVIMSGNFVDECGDKRKLNRIGRWYKPWFHHHVEAFLTENRTDQVEFIPTYDFFHRHNRSCFWILDYIIPFGNNPVFR